MIRTGKSLPKATAPSQHVSPLLWSHTQHHQSRLHCTQLELNFRPCTFKAPRNVTSPRRYVLRHRNCAPYRITSSVLSCFILLVIWSNWSGSILPRPFVTRIILRLYAKGFPALLVHCASIICIAITSADIAVHGQKCTVGASVVRTIAIVSAAWPNLISKLADIFHECPFMD